MKVPFHSINKKKMYQSIFFFYQSIKINFYILIKFVFYPAGVRKVPGHLPPCSQSYRGVSRHAGAFCRLRQGAIRGSQGTGEGQLLFQKLFYFAIKIYHLSRKKKYTDLSQWRFIIYLEKKSIQTFIIRWYIISMYYIAAAMYCIATSRSATAKSRERTICILFIHEIFFWTFWRHYNLI